MPGLRPDDLVLVPTQGERTVLSRLLGADEPPLRLCGFGPVVAAARATELLLRHRPPRVVLLGIAGTYDETRAPVATVSRFGGVALDGVGAGEGAGSLGPAELGIVPWPGADEHPEPLEEVLALDGPPERRLLTVCAASSSPAMARARRARYAGVLAEDMEGFAVATACGLVGVPLVVIRGMSNVAGDRDVGRWQIKPALASVAEELRGARR